VALDFDAPLEVLTVREGVVWFARIQELELTGEGESRQAALGDLRRAVRTFRTALELMDDWQPVSARSRKDDARLVRRGARGKDSSEASVETWTLNQMLG